MSNKKKSDDAVIGNVPTHVLHKEQRELDARIRAEQGGLVPVNQGTKSDGSNSGGGDNSDLIAQHQLQIKTLEDGHAAALLERDNRIAELEEALAKVQQTATQTEPEPTIIEPEPEPKSAKK